MFNVPNIIADINSFSEMILHLTSLYNLPEILEYSFCKALLADKITVCIKMTYKCQHHKYLQRGAR